MIGSTKKLATVLGVCFIACVNQGSCVVHKGEAVDGVTDRYTLLANSESVAVVLRRSDGGVIANITSERTGNFSQAVVDYFLMNGLDAGTRTVQSLAVLMESANGGECDACTTLIEEAALQLLDLQERMERMAQENAAHTGKRYHELTGVTIDAKAIQSEFGGLCQNERYKTRHAMHIKQGCVEIMNGGRVLEVYTAMANLSVPDRSKTGLGGFKRQLCSQMYSYCPHTAAPPKRLGKCRRCAEFTEDWHYTMRRTIRSGYSLKGDPMNLQKKPTHVGYLSRRHVLLSLQELCADVVMRHGEEFELHEACEEFISDHEDDLVELGMRGLGSPGEAMCVDIMGACTKEQYAAVQSASQSYNYMLKNVTKLLPEKALKRNQEFRDALANDELEFGETAADAKGDEL